MDELDVQGKKYISSKRGAELTGYAKDYIGQLARSGKVPGTRFGRAWFVEEAALLKHLGAEVTQAETEDVEEAPVVASKVPVTTQAKKPLLSHHMITPAVLPKTWSAVQYLNDDSDLFPVITPRIVDVPVAPKVVAEEKKPSVEIRVPVHVAPSTVSVEKRVAALVDGIRPRSAVLRVAQVSAPKLAATRAPAIRALPEQKKKEVTKAQAPQTPLRKSVAVRWSPGSFANAAAVFILVVGSLVSFSVMKNISLGGTEALTASSIYGLTDFLEVLENAHIFDAGIEAIRSFYMMLSQSFTMYLKTGFDFIVELL